MLRSVALEREDIPVETGILAREGGDGCSRCRNEFSSGGLQRMCQ